DHPADEEAITERGTSYSRTRTITSDTAVTPGVRDPLALPQSPEPSVVGPLRHVLPPPPAPLGWHPAHCGRLRPSRRRARRLAGAAHPPARAGRAAGGRPRPAWSSGCRRPPGPPR